MRSSHPCASCFSIQHLQCLAVPQDRYGERSEPPLKIKRLSQQRKESKPLGALTPHSPLPGLARIAFAVRGIFSLSNSVQCSVQHGNDWQHRPGDVEKAGAAIEKRSRSSTRTVHGCVTNQNENAYIIMPRPVLTVKHPSWSSGLLLPRVV